MPKTPPLKTSIYLGPEVLSVVTEREVGPGSRSEVIRACIERYGEVCRRHCPTLLDEEWGLLFQALNEDWLAQIGSPAYIRSAVDDWVALVPGAEHLGALVEKLRAMRYVELVAVLDRAERHWAAVNRDSGAGIQAV
jgi:hypothetical protein